MKLTTKTDAANWLRAAALVPYGSNGLVETLINGKLSLRQEDASDAIANLDAFRDALQSLAVFDNRN